MTDRIPLDHLTSDQYDRLCSELVDLRQFATMVEQSLAIARLNLDRAKAELAELRAVARGYCPHCGRGDAAPTVADWEQQKRRADQAEELLSIAHDTSNKSEAERARAQAAVDRVRALADECDANGYSSGHPLTVIRVRAALDQPAPAAATRHQEQPMHKPCTATIEGPHVLDGGPVQCTREARHPGNHVGPTQGSNGKTLWDDWNAGATPHKEPTGA